ncbi:phosphopyruvate hydratase [Alphaproteobacteria bacterium]|nr:phosphopyruvate hydratase [Alphaproteobacteria bacterium]
MSSIINIFGREIFDSRGNPTIEVEINLEDGSKGVASVPSGASTGSYEAIEKRDGGERFQGKGVLDAIDNINNEIFNVLSGIDSTDQRLIDETLIDLDGTENKSRLGANAILGVSLANAKASAEYLDLPLYRYIGGISSNRLPVPMMNILNGGMHADNKLDIQEFMIVPIGSKNFSDSLRVASDISNSLKSRLISKGLNTNVGDEGGFAPALNSTHETLDHLIESIIKAGYKPDQDVSIALDVASNEIYKDNIYNFYGEGIKKNSDQMIDFLVSLVDNYPIYSIEDGMAEDDWDGWVNLTKALGNKINLVGDDLFVTNANRLKKGIELSAGNAILIKVNQIGTLTEALDTVYLAQRNSYKAIISHRSGETEDSLIADIAVACNCGLIKAGALNRSDRISKYNRLLKIEQELGDSAIFY